MIKLFFSRAPIWLYVVRWISVLVVLVMVGGPALFLTAVQDIAASLKTIVAEIGLQHEKELSHGANADMAVPRK
jgi:hypothetical protein